MCNRHLFDMTPKRLFSTGGQEEVKEAMPEVSEEVLEAAETAEQKDIKEAIKRSVNYDNYK